MIRIDDSARTASGRRGFLAGAAAVAGGLALAPNLDTASASTEGPKIVRTPAERFAGLPDYPFKPKYARIRLRSGEELRMHYIDVRPSDPAKASGETVVLLHGNPSWSYLYRHVIPPLVAAGHRCIAVDLIGFGKSDKVIDRFAYTYPNHIDWLEQALFRRLGLREITLVCHDWGGTLGLLLVARNPTRFRRVVASNTGLRAGGPDLGPGWQYVAKWLQFTQRTQDLRPSEIVDGFALKALTPRVRAAYDAPYPGDEFLHGVRRFAVLIPITAEDEANPMIAAAWTMLEKLHTPFLCVFSAEDHVSHGDHSALSDRIPGAQGQPHVSIPNAAHFVQEDRPAEFGAAVNAFIRSTR
ncbi:haloalkane dehalogenase [Kribbella sp. VKM Ac-2527]|uniref:Haloalkane dehalogenase n=1 Tax=Kribbella caucasensis TaxID=2512215 RepID=A0A4R6KCH3_9ACTN|nr:haloalkane dehalogenase [Kribbella sp. VKM Ac-2527]TDO45442.1 haloalkane dehalogenase [Kribbella sp. VKM Ac-2527]